MTENLNPHPANLSLAKQQEMTLMQVSSAGAKIPLVPIPGKES
jgi:L-serine deaminase